jgi:hypothetical protein
MSAFLDGIGAVVKKVTEFIPGRIEKLKNEKQRLLNERELLMSKEFSASGSRRVVAIDSRLCEINAILSNKASD